MINTISYRRVRRGGGGGALGARAPSHLEKKFRSEMSKRGEKVSPRYVGKKNTHVPLRCNKIKTKKGKKKKKSKRKGIKLKKEINKEDSRLSEIEIIPSRFFHVYLPLLLF